MKCILVRLIETRVVFEYEIFHKIFGTFTGLIETRVVFECGNLLNMGFNLHRLIETRVVFEFEDIRAGAK